MNLSRQDLAALPAPPKGNTTYRDLEGRGNVRGLGFRVTANGARAWTLDYMDAAGIRHNATLGRWPDLTLAQARAKAAKARTVLAEGGGGPLETKRAEREQAKRDKSVAELADLWLTQHAQVYKRASSIYNDRSILRRHILPRLGTMKVTEVGRVHVQALHAAIMENAPVQANRVLGLLTTLMNFALDNGYRSDNPCRKIRKHAEQGRVVHTTREQLNRLYDALQAHPDRQAADAIKLLVWTGSRKGEVLGAQWAEFDLARRVWVRPAQRTKQKQVSIIPLNELAVKLLSEMRARDGSNDLLFPSGTDPTRPRKSLRRFWIEVTKTAGLPTLHVHDLRHVFATTALESGVPLDAIAPLLGHSNTVMTRRYAHWSQDALRAATDKASKLLGARPI